MDTNSSRLVSKTPLPPIQPPTKFNKTAMPPNLSSMSLAPKSTSCGLPRATEVDGVANDLLEKFGGIDILLNFVGGWIGGKGGFGTKREEVGSMMEQTLY